MRSLDIFCVNSLDTIVTFGSRACVLVSFDSLQAPSIGVKYLLSCLIGVWNSPPGVWYPFSSLSVFRVVKTSSIGFFWAIASPMRVVPLTSSRQVVVPSLMFPRGVSSCTVTFFEMSTWLCTSPIGVNMPKVVTNFFCKRDYPSCSHVLVGGRSAWKSFHSKPLQKNVVKTIKKEKSSITHRWRPQCDSNNDIYSEYL